MEKAPRSVRGAGWRRRVVVGLALVPAVVSEVGVTELARSASRRVRPLSFATAPARARRREGRRVVCEAPKGRRELGEELLEKWRSLASRDLISDRVRRLERVEEQSLDDLVSSAEIDRDALERDMARLREECAYMSRDELEVVREALVAAHAAHSGQVRRSGEPYVVHPVEVASLLASLKMDVETVAAGLLHDTVEDTAVTFDMLEARFGSTLRKIVEGETKVSKLPKLAQRPPPAEHDEEDPAWLERMTTTTKKPPARHIVDDDEARADEAFSVADEQAENLRQMFIAMTDDYRIIIVKLADRLHNMRTLEHMPRHKQSKIAWETLEIFAPLAHRLGIWNFKSELEDIAFRYAHPREYETLREALEIRTPRFTSALAGSKAALEAAFEGRRLDARRRRLRLRTHQGALLALAQAPKNGRRRRRRRPQPLLRSRRRSGRRRPQSRPRRPQTLARRARRRLARALRLALLSSPLPRPAPRRLRPRPRRQGLHILP